MGLLLPDYCACVVESSPLICKEMVLSPDLLDSLLLFVMFSVCDIQTHLELHHLLDIGTQIILFGLANILNVLR